MYSKERTDVYEELLGDQPSPPKSVITRWGTFLKTALHHRHDFDEIKIFVFRIDARAADNIALKSTVEGPDLLVQLREIVCFAVLRGEAGMSLYTNAKPECHISLS